MKRSVSIHSFVAHGSTELSSSKINIDNPVTVLNKEHKRRLRIKKHSFQSTTGVCHVIVTLHMHQPTHRLICFLSNTLVV